MAKKTPLPDKAAFQMVMNHGVGVGYGWLVGTPPCIVVHGLALKRQPVSRPWTLKRTMYSMRGPWVMSTLHTGLAIEHSLFRFVDPRDAIRVAEYIAIIAPMLDVPLYSTSVHEVHEAVLRTGDAFMEAIRDHLQANLPLMRVDQAVKSYEGTAGWRAEFVKYVVKYARREL